MNNAGLRRAGRPGRIGARALPAVALVVAATAASTGTSAGVEPTALLPDLVADPVTNPIMTTYEDPSGERSLLRFDGYVHNRGVGPVELRGAAPVSGEQTQVGQRIYHAGGGYEDVTSDATPRILFEPEDGHNHWHLNRAAQYSLRGPIGEVAAQKVGFCLVDSQHVDTWGPATATYTTSNNRFCEQNNSAADSVTMGVSAGWRDLYHRYLAFQWVDISDVQPGHYQIKSDVDPGNVIIESDENNKPAFIDFTVPGYVAKDFSEQVSSLLPSSLTLRADKFGSAGTRQFRIDKAPEHGTLSRREGGWFSGSLVTYTPNLGYSGEDSFRFSARDASNPSFPRDPRSATASLGVGGGGPLPLVAEPVAPATVDAEPRRAPDVAQPLPDPDGGLLAAPQVELRDGDLIARTVPRRAGTVRLSMLSTDGSMATCEADIPAGQPFTCLLATGLTAADLHGKTVVAELLAAGRVVGSRSAPAGS